MHNDIFESTPEATQLLLDRELDYIQSVFFPDWNLSGEWTIGGLSHHKQYSAGMNFSKRKIYVHDDMLEINDGQLVHLAFVRGLIIHEVCHAVLSKRWKHGRLWVETLVDCSIRAEQLKMTDLAEHLWEDVFVNCVRTGRIVSAKIFYVKIKQMLQANPELTFPDITYSIFEIVLNSEIPFLGDKVREEIFYICRDAYEVAKGKKLRNKRYFFIKPR